MKIKEWSQKILWFFMGAVVAGCLIIATTSQGKPSQDIHQIVAGHEQRIRALEKHNADQEKHRREFEKNNRPRLKECHDCD